MIGEGRGGGGAEIAHDKRMQKKWFNGEVEYERFYRYLRYASMNTFEHLAAVSEEGRARSRKRRKRRGRRANGM